MPEQLDELKAERREKSARVAHLQGAIGKLRSLQGDVDTAQRNLADHDADAADALREWAETGGEGDPPLGDHLSRLGLLRGLARAQAALAQSGEAIDVLTGQQRQASDELQSVNAKIDEHAFEALRSEHAADVAAFARYIEIELRPRLARLQALSVFYFEKGLQHANSGREEQAREIRLVGESLTRASEALPDGNPLPSDIIAATAHWAKRHAELTSDAQANVVEIGTAA